MTLDHADLPEHALRTTLRMFAAIVPSLVFTLVVATLAANSRKAGSRSCRRRRRPNGTGAHSPARANRRQAPHDPALRGAVQPIRKVLRSQPIRAAFARVKMQEERCYAASEARFETKTSQ
jgi:hypothetical protein